MDTLPVGTAWLVDAAGCDPGALRSTDVLASVLRRAVLELGLNPLAAPVLHAFPGAGGVTGFVLLSESHLAVHTFPEREAAAFDLYCCRPRPRWPWEERLAEMLGARKVAVRAIERGIA